MARILWHGISPYHRTGYGVQCRLTAPALRDLGHKIVIAAMGDPHPEDRKHGAFDGIPIIGHAGKDFDLPRPADIRAAFGGRNPDLILILKDAWVLPGKQYQGWNAACWCAIDTHPMGQGDRRFFATSGARPVAVSKHGLAMMRAAGLRDALYVPHGIDTGFWSPGYQPAARDLLGLDRDMFIAGMNAANFGQPPRKAFAEQFAAWGRFHAKHPNSVLLAHTVPDHPEGMPLRPILAQLGIPDDAVRFGKSMFQTEVQLRSWYRSLDVLMSATYGEGFGVPIAEAISCGVPVIGTDCTAIPENIPPGGGWLVKGQRFYVPAHHAWWTVPSIAGIGTALDKAWKARGRGVRPELAAQFDHAAIARNQWKTVVEELCR